MISKQGLMHEEVQMRFTCEFITDKIPVAYNMMMLSAIKSALSKVSEEYYDELYRYENDKKNKKIKPFTFSLYLKGYEFKEDEILIKDKIVLNVSTSDYNFGINIYNGLLAIRDFTYKNKYVLHRKKITLVKEKLVEGSEAVFRTLSPIFIKDKDNNAVTLEDPRFSELLNYITDISLNSHRGYGLRESLQLIPINMKKQIVKEEIAEFTEKTNKRYFMINGYSGVFKLIGDKEDLKLIQQLGVGYRRSQGLGNIEIM
jgi:CRISPR-associated endoribonuclease Cas6